MDSRHQIGLENLKTVYIGRDDDLNRWSVVTVICNLKELFK